MFKWSKFQAFAASSKGSHLSPCVLDAKNITPKKTFRLLVPPSLPRSPMCPSVAVVGVCGRAGRNRPADHGFLPLGV